MKLVVIQILFVLPPFFFLLICPLSYTCFLDLGEKTNSVINEKIIHFEEHLKENTIIIEDLPVPPTTSNSKKREPLVTKLVFFKWICDQCKDDKNRYAFQMATAFTLAALFVVIKPVAHIFENAFWIGKL
jgi:hypothetical protein